MKASCWMSGFYFSVESHLCVLKIITPGSLSLGLGSSCWKDTAVKSVFEILLLLHVTRVHCYVIKYTNTALISCSYCRSSKELPLCWKLYFSAV